MHGDVKQAIQKLKDYHTSLSVKKEMMEKILSSLKSKHHNPIVDKQIDELDKIVRSIKL
jgi:hypothetical protein